MKYSNYSITVAYDGKPVHWQQWYENALDAVNSFNKFVDHGFADEFATVNLIEASGKMHTRHFYRNGKVSGK